jgi:hypothetical protein
VTDYDNWLRFFSCKRGLADFLDAAKIVTGSQPQATTFFSAFDDYSSDNNSILSRPQT